ncbi:holin [Lacticaseibacillus absianus]|uniref:holin n=1 Tax=Lacticaseibacillus absianus TaxID=2729623 RepID=UPI0015CA6992|nr:holin [Lacticaseibacillus absianus]
MENELLQLTVIAAIIAPITAALVQGIKTASGISDKLNIVVSLLVGIALAGLWSLTFGHIDQIGPYLMAGMLSGLSASGLYDLTKQKGEPK